ncbi:hypothetical protein [Helicobacter sp. 11S02596-1]|uniref:hypothetical protein n=1 Tax=Helicobacter sp. 11S02596-1 TaxID=1476194 RepID=UPI00117A0AD6|nr:hypothetical protein [Helicobacter sp. 11S02596-1]
MNALFAQNLLASKKPNLKDTQKISDFLDSFCKKITKSYIDNDKSKIYFNANRYTNMQSKDFYNLSLKDSSFDNLTALECSCNAVHIDDFIHIKKDKVAHIALMFLIWVGDFLQKKFSDYAFCIITSIETDYDIDKKIAPPFCLTNRLNLKFHIIRENEDYLFEDLDSYLYDAIAVYQTTRLLERKAQSQPIKN